VRVEAAASGCYRPPDIGRRLGAVLEEEVVVADAGCVEDYGVVFWCVETHHIARI
jgi:hypothetical protein